VGGDKVAALLKKVATFTVGVGGRCVKKGRRETNRDINSYRGVSWPDINIVTFIPGGGSARYKCEASTFVPSGATTRYKCEAFVPVGVIARYKCPLTGARQSLSSTLDTNAHICTRG
jgi:hypothetical protein